MRVVFVHGACVRDGAWWWHRTAAVLECHGVTSVAPALPSCGEGDRPAGADGPGLAEDVAAVRATLRDSDEPTVVVAHSYGGIVTAAAADGVAAVSHVLLISSYLAEPGESLSTFGPAEPAPFLDVDPAAGTLAVRPDGFEDRFMQDCRDVAADATARLVPQSLSIVGTPVETSVMQRVPTTYLVCADDRGTPADAQREFARRADGVVELDAGHHAFLSQPEAVARIVRDVAA